MHRGERHHHGGKTFVAGGDADDSRARREGAGEPAKDKRRVVAVGKAIEHADGSLGAAIARVGAVSGERNRFESAQFLSRGLNEQTDLPMAGVITERDRLAVWSAHAALSAEDEKLFAAEFARVPSHTGVLSQTENIAAGGIREHLGGER